MKRKYTSTEKGTHLVCTLRPQARADSSNMLGMSFVACTRLGAQGPKRRGYLFQWMCTKSLIVLALIVLAGCGGGQNAPCKGHILVTVRAASSINVDDSGRSLPTVVRWLQFEVIDQVESLTFEDFWAQYGAEGAAPPGLVAAAEFQTFPGRTQKVDIPWNPKARYLVVAGMFRKPDGGPWREMIQLRNDENDDREACGTLEVPLEIKGSSLWTTDKDLRVRSKSRAKAASTPVYKTAATDSLGLRFDTEQTKWNPFLQQLLPPQELSVFHLSYLANGKVESSHKATFSALHTTAGSEMRASFGIGQLTIEAHLEQLSLLTQKQLQELGVEGLEEMKRRGRATYYWFRLMQGHPLSNSQRDMIGLNVRLAGNLASLVRSEAWVTLASSYGPAFEKSTGIDGAAVLDMARTMLLDRREYRTAFKDRYARLFGEPYRPGNHNLARMAEAAQAVVGIEPKLAPVLRSLGGTGGAASLGHYLGTGDFSENVHGWYTRAAQSVKGWSNFTQMLERVDPTTTRMRHARDLKTALAALSKTDLQGLERAKLAARIARQFHIAPGSAGAYFFLNGDVAQPRYAQSEPLYRALNTYLVDYVEREWSDKRLIVALNTLIEKYDSNARTAGQDGQQGGK